MLYYVLSAILAYLLGSVSFGILLSQLLHRDDIRHHGSGNAGTTNALRTYGGSTAFWVFLGDFLKGTLAVFIAGQLCSSPVLGENIAALAVVLGHLFPVFFRFRGGKGVATAAGAILVLNPPVLALLILPFGLILLLTRYMSLAAITVAGLFPLMTALYRWLGGPMMSDSWVEVAFATVIGGLVIFMHRANIGRLLAGTESKLGKKHEKASKNRAQKL